MALNVARLKPYFYVFGVLLSLLVLMDQVNANRVDLQVLHWHLKNGFKARCCGIEIKIPLKYTGDDGPGISLTNLPGRFRRTYFHSSFSMVSVNSIHRVKGSDDEHQVELGKGKMLAMKERGGFKLVNTNTLNVAGRHLQCYEFNKENPLGPNYHELIGSVYDIWCFGEGLGISFFGDRTLRDEFYSMIKTAKATSN